MKYKILLLLLIAVISKTAFAQTVETVKNPNLPYHYLVHYPAGYKENPNKKYPLLMFLHGRSISGTDVEKVKSYGVIYEILRGLKIDFIVVAPQCQNGWDNSKLIQILDFAENNYHVDKNRVYITGMSMGGYGAWMFAGAYPTRFAAVAPVCGGGNIKDANNLKNMPHWVFHGAKDIPVPITESEKMVNAIRDAGNKRVEFTVYKDWGHSELVVVFSKKELYDWFLKFDRGLKETKPEPKPEPKLEPVLATIEQPKPKLEPKTSTLPLDKPAPQPQKEKEPEILVFEEPKKEKIVTVTKIDPPKKDPPPAYERPTLVQRKPEPASKPKPTAKPKNKLNKRLENIKNWELWDHLK
jgi:hypothetical protein